MEVSQPPLLTLEKIDIKTHTITRLRLHDWVSDLVSTNLLSPCSYFLVFAASCRRWRVWQSARSDRWRWRTFDESWSCDPLAQRRVRIRVFLHEKACITNITLNSLRRTFQQEYKLTCLWAYTYRIRGSFGKITTLWSAMKCNTPVEPEAH